MEVVTMAPSSVRLVEGEARRFGEIDLIARLGHGGMAEVFLASRRDRPGDLVVLKRLKDDLDDPEHRSMFTEEARIMPLLQHPNIVRTTAAGEQDGRQYLSMEFLDGLPLDQCSPSVVQLGERAALHVVAELLEGLHYAHELRDPEGASLELVHRDVSPHNVFITYEGRVTLVDFGIAKRRGRTQHTATGVVRGKLSYMAPEQALCDSLDRRADVFSAGVILWELLTGRRYWEGLSEVQILKRMTFGDLPKIRDVVPDLRADVVEVLDQALTVKPEERFVTARAFREAIAAIGSGPMPRLELGGAVSEMAEDYRAALRDLVDRHLEQARGTTGLPGISRIQEEIAISTEDGDASAPVESAGSDALSPVLAAFESAAKPSASSSELAPRSWPSSEHKPITETGAATIVAVTPPVPPSRGLRWWSVGAAVVGAVVVGVWIVPRSIETDGRASQAKETDLTTSPSTSRTSPSPGSSSTTAEVSVHVSVVPGHAKVYLDGMRVARLPFDASFPKDHVGHKLTVSADGYSSKSQIVVFDRDVKLTIELDPANESSGEATAVTSAVATASDRPRIAPRLPATASKPGPVTKPKSGGFIECDPWKPGSCKK